MSRSLFTSTPGVVWFKEAIGKGGTSRQISEVNFRNGIHRLKDIFVSKLINKTWPIHHLRCVVSTTSFAWGDRSPHWTCGRGERSLHRGKLREGSVCPFLDFICSSSFRHIYSPRQLRWEKNYSSLEIVLYSGRFADNRACWWIISQRMRQATVTRITSRLSVNVRIYSFETLASRIERREKTGKLGETM